MVKNRKEKCYGLLKQNEKNKNKKSMKLYTFCMLTYKY